MTVSLTPRRLTPRRAGIILACVSTLALLFGGTSARADISPAGPIDGPSADIVGLGGVAMAADGTGGLVYRKRVAGRVHIFAARFVGGQWLPPQQVDVGQRFDSSWPVIGAGDGGRLVVAWVQEFGVGTDRMFFAALDPGASSFQAPQVLDPNVGEATATHPSLAMNPGGQALISYRVISNSQPGPTLPVGYVQADIRIARYDGSYWSVSGTPVERNPDQPERTPTAANSPKVAIGTDGAGVVAWQEPDDDFYDRIYARRVFGSSVGYVQEASPTAIGKRPLHAGVDSFTVADAGFGTIGVLMRQLPPPDGGFTRPRVYLNQMPTQFDDKAAFFEGARPIDGTGGDGPDPAVGGFGLALDTNAGFEAVYGAGAQSFAVTGDEFDTYPRFRLDDGASSAGGDPLVTLADSGARVRAWKVLANNAGAVSVVERAADGAPSTRTIFSPTGGVVHDLRLAGSGLGDAAIAFLQGDDTNTTIQAGSVDAPPDTFGVATPATWVRGKRVRIEWDTSPHAIGGVYYELLVDDQIVASHLLRTHYTLSTRAVGNGDHIVRVAAIDPAGQEGDSNPADLLLDHAAPRVRVRVARTRRRVLVSVSDGQRGQSSGVGPTRISWGDGTRSMIFGRRAAHTYRRHGRRRIVLGLTDRAGNRRVSAERVYP